MSKTINGKSQLDGKALAIKLIGIVIIIIAVLNFVLLFLGRSSPAVFWIVTAFAAASAYWGIPALSSKQ